MRDFGRTNPIEVIPHGCDLPDQIIPTPKQFSAGYLGSCTSPDKGVIYLLQAWKKLNLSDSILYLGGRDSNHPFMKELISQYGGGNIRILSWVENVSSFYNQIALYVQPSVTEGFGIEILEAMAHGRAVIASKGAGGHEVLANQDKTFEIRNVDQLCDLIQGYYKDRNSLWHDATRNRVHAENFTWQKVRQQYVALWKKLAGGDRN
jgi:glycosyltransferase involved in cell wall biosynthesis